MKRILFLLAIALISLFSFYGCDDENKILSEENDKPTATDSIPAADSIRISIMLNCDSLLLYTGDVDTLLATVKKGDKIVDYKVSWSTNGTQIAVVDSNGVVTALSVGTAVITVKYKDVIYTCKVVVTERPKTYEYVDLGLSVLWATYNVGATKPEEFGDYYAWGETESKTDYSWETYKWCKGEYNTMTKYCNNIDYGYNGFTDAKTTLALEDDVAHVKWGGSWRMSTKAEWDELRNNCTWTWTTVNGVEGYLVTSNKSGYTDRSIFLPAAGHRDADIYGILDVGVGCYWSSSLLPYLNYAHCHDFDSSVNLFGNIINDRCMGRSVRPVCPSEGWLSSVSINMVEDKKTLLVDGNVLFNVCVKQYGEVLKNTPVIWSSDNPSVAVVDENGVVTAISVGIAQITASIQSLSAQCSVTVTDDKTEIEYEYVDLGLSVKWATFNVGATRPEEYGCYYAWGETYTKSIYNWTNYKFRTSGDSEYNVRCSKYVTNSSYGLVDNRTTLEPEDDVAHVKWGGTWRMPTWREQLDLYLYCTWADTTINGVKGFLVTSNESGYTDRSIFLPATGLRYDERLYEVGNYGIYWSSSLFSDDPNYPNCAYSCGFSDCFVNLHVRYRSIGQPVRPVCP